MGDTRLIPVKTITPQKSGVIVKLLYLFSYGSPEYTIKGLDSEEEIGKFKHSLRGDLRDYFSSMNDDAYQSDFEDVFSRSDFMDKHKKFYKLLKDGNKDFVILSLQAAFIRSVNNSRLVFDFKAEKERLEMYEADLSGLNIGSKLLDGKKVPLDKKMFATTIVPRIRQDVKMWLRYCKDDIEARYTGHMKWIEYIYLRQDPAIEGISNILGFTACPSPKIWDGAVKAYKKSEKEYTAGESALEKIKAHQVDELAGYNRFLGHMRAVLQQIDTAKAELQKGIEKMNKYRESNLLGAGRALAFLRVIKDVSFTLLKELIKVPIKIINPVAGAAVGALVDTGVKAVEELATRLSEKVNLNEDFKMGDYLIVLGFEAAGSFAGNLLGDFMVKKFAKAYFNKFKDTLAKELLKRTEVYEALRSIGVKTAAMGEESMAKIIKGNLRYIFIETAYKKAPKDLVKKVIDFTLKHYRMIEERPSKNEFRQTVNDNLFKEILKTDNLFKLILKEACAILARNAATLSSS